MAHLSPEAGKECKTMNAAFPSKENQVTIQNQTKPNQGLYSQKRIKLLRLGSLLVVYEIYYQASSSDPDSGR